MTCITGNTIMNHEIDHSTNLRVVKSDIGYHFEVMRDKKLVIGMYFLYGEKTHKAAYSLGGAIYAYFHDDEMAEDAMRIIEENNEILGGYELTR